MRVMELAYALGKSEGEILALSVEEFARWLAFFKERDRLAKQNQKTQTNSGLGPGRTAFREVL